MILLLHIGIALISVGFAGYTFVVPSKTKLKISFGLVGGTLASGTALIITDPAHMLHACMAGLFYTAILLTMTILIQHKLNRTAIAEEVVNKR